jgi:GT2 family glycosyltransferase
MVDTATQPAVKHLSVSVLLVVHDASRYLTLLLEDIAKQDYPKEAMEVIVVDGGSTDDTADVVGAWARTHPEQAVRCAGNPKGILSAGWNIAIQLATGDIVIRIDAHSRIPPDFVSRSAACLAANEGESVCGGQRVSVCGQGLVATALWLCETSKFGAGAARFRSSGEKRYLDTLAHAAYRRQVFAHVGTYDERLQRNQDIEMHCRMRRAGFRLLFDPRIVSYHQVRSTFRKYIAQKWQTGIWIGLLLAVQPRAIGLRHILPACLVTVLMAWGMLQCLGSGAQLIGPLPVAVVAAYCGAALSSALPRRERSGCGNWIAICSLPALMFMTHVSYGVGTIWGLFNIPAFLLFAGPRWSQRCSH